MSKYKRQIIRDNKIALYIHIAKKRVYIYLPKNAIIEKDKENGYIVKINEIKEEKKDFLNKIIKK